MRYVCMLCLILITSSAYADQMPKSPTPLVSKEHPAASNGYQQLEKAVVGETTLIDRLVTKPNALANVTIETAGRDLLLSQIMAIIGESRFARAYKISLKKRGFTQSGPSEAFMRSNADGTRVLDMWGVITGTNGPCRWNYRGISFKNVRENASLTCTSNGQRVTVAKPDGWLGDNELPLLRQALKRLILLHRGA